jgi:hypothetical protein
MNRQKDKQTKTSKHFFSYVVNRLEPYTPYEFMVVPFYRGLSGQPSALYKAMTLEAKPVEAPTQLAWCQCYKTFLLHDTRFGIIS